VDRRDVVVMGASSGGVSALLKVAAGLPPQVPAVVLVTLHIGANTSALPVLLSLHGNNPARHPADGESLRPGTVYIAPPDCHLLVSDSRVVLSHGAKEHHTRPAIDPLFRSAALECGRRTVGVILTGRGDDGAAGLRAVKDCGGAAVVQDPADAEHPDMPRASLRAVEPDACVPLDAVASTVTRIIGEAVPLVEPPAAARERIAREMAVFAGKGNGMDNLDAIGRPSKFTCPDCGGVVWEIDESQPPRFRCHTGHAFSLRSLEETQAAIAEDALWTALRALQQNEALLRRLAQLDRASGDADEAQRRTREADEVAQELRRLEARLRHG